MIRGFATAAVACAAILAAALSGSVLWPSILVMLVSSSLAMRSRFGAPFAIGASVLLSGGLLLATMVATAALGLPLVPTVTVVATCVSLSMAAAVGFGGGLRGRPSREALSVLIPAMAAALVVPALAALAWLQRGESSLSWVMRGDAALFHIVARQVVEDGGVVLGPDANAVPLPTAIFALAIDPGRSRVDSAQLLEHDLAGLAVLWAGLIGLSALLAGVVVGSIVRRARRSPTAIAIASTAGGLLLTSWLFTGYPVQYGFLNAHVAMVVVLASTLITLERRSLTSTAVALVAACVLLSATWSVLAALPFALLVTVAVQDRASWRRLTARHAAALAAAGVLGAAYLAAAVLPGLLAGHAAQLADAGATAEDLPIWIVVIVVVAAIALAWRGRRDSPRLPAVLVAISVAGAIGLAALLGVTGFQWTYYPRKMTWLLALTVIVPALGALFVAVGEALARWRAAIVGQTGAAAVALALVGGLPGTPGVFDSADLAAHVVHGGVMTPGDEVGDIVLALADPETPRVLWRSGLPGEPMITFWLLMSTADPGESGSELVAFAYEPDRYGEVDRLCDIAAATGPLEVVSADSSLPEQVEAACPAIELRFSTTESVVG